jgi:hypothetical protein
LVFPEAFFTVGPPGDATEQDFDTEEPGVLFVRDFDSALGTVAEFAVLELRGVSTQREDCVA